MLIRYIHLNPLRAGLVKDLMELDHYPWSGHAVLMGKQKMDGQEIKEVLQYFGKKLSVARRSYREFTSEGIKEGKREDLTGGGMKRSQGLRSNQAPYESYDVRVLGSGDFVESLWKREELRDKVKRVLSLPELVKQIAFCLNLKAEEIFRPSKERSLAEARGIISYLAVRKLGYKGIDVGKELGLGHAGVSLAIRRGELLFRENPELKKKLVSELEK